MAPATPATSGSDTAARRERDTRHYRVAVWALLVCLAAVAVVTFVLSFQGLNDYGRGVADLGRLAWLVPIGVDGLTLTAIAATFLLATAPFRVRLYAWSVFVVANAASVAGNLSHAHHRNLSWDGAVGAAAWPIMLTLASHLAIVTRRWLVTRHDDSTAPAVKDVFASPDVAPMAGLEFELDPDPEPDVAPEPEPDVAPEPEPDVAPEPEPDVAPAPVVAERHPAPRRRGRHTKPGRAAVSDTALRDEARRLYLAETPWAHIAATVGRDKRTVQRWTADLRQPAPAEAATATSVPAPINGREVHA